LLVIDKGKNPTEAITLSNNYTYGNKGRLFCISFLVSLAFMLVFIIIAAIAKAVMPNPWTHPGLTKTLLFFFGLIYIFIGLVMMFIFIGVQASIYKQLTENIRTRNTARAVPAPATPAPTAVSGSFCPACGMKNPPGTKFCGACGAQV